MLPSRRTELVNLFFMRELDQTFRVENASPVRVTSNTAAPCPYAADKKTRSPPRRSGCATLIPMSVTHGYSQSSFPPSVVTPTARRRVTTRIWRTPPSVTSIGDVYAWGSSSDVQSG